MWISIFLLYFIVTFFILSFYFADNFIAERSSLKTDSYKNKQSYVFMATLLLTICFIAIYYLFKYFFVILYKYNTTRNYIHLSIAMFVLALIITFAMCSGKIISAIYPLTAFYLFDPTRNREFSNKPQEQQFMDIGTIVIYMLLIIGFAMYFGYQGYEYYQHVNLTL